MSNPVSFAQADARLNEEALIYHSEPSPGKTAIEINLEDIAAPHCFEIEQSLTDALDIPVFHDDQHGTAIIIAAGLLNALELQQKTLEDARIVLLGAGAAGIAAVRLLMTLGARRSNIFAVDRQGVIHTGRRDLNPSTRACSGLSRPPSPAPRLRAA